MNAAHLASIAFAARHFAPCFLSPYIPLSLSLSLSLSLLTPVLRVLAAHDKILDFRTVQHSTPLQNLQSTANPETIARVLVLVPPPLHPTDLTEGAPFHS